MIAYFIIFVLIGVIIIQTVIYYREKLKLYNIIQSNKLTYNSRDEPDNRKNSKKHYAGHKRALENWRNGGRGGDIH